MVSQRHSLRQTVLASCILFVAFAAAGKPQGQWQPAHCSSCEQGGTPAQQPACPSSMPVSCSSISDDDYCCPASNFCMWANSQVVCCPDGCDCNEPQSSWAAPPKSSWAPQSTWAQSSWKPTSTWHAHSSWAPSTTWHSSWHPTSHSTITTKSTTATTSAESGTATCDECVWNPTNWNGVYCSTIFAQGGNLPTTAHAACGVVLVKEASSDTIRVLVSWTKMITMVMGLQVLGGFFLVWR